MESLESSDDEEIGPQPCGVGNSEQCDNENATMRAGTTFGFPLAFGKLSWKERAKRDAMEKAKLTTARTTEGTSLEESAGGAAALRHMIRDDVGGVMPHASRERLTKDTTDGNGATSLPGGDVGDDDDDGDAPLVPPPLFVPLASSTSFEAHLRSVTALALNPKATRLVTGGHDSEVRLWDFNGMTSDPEPFRRFTPVAGHGIRAFAYSPTGSHFACAAGDAVCRIYNLDGRKVQETVKGDMYVRDLSQTKGHTHAVNDCDWHPVTKERFLAASSDATVRIFDLTAKPYGVDQALPHVHILKAVDKRNLNIAGQCRVTAARFAPETAKFVVGGCSDGSLQLWNERRVYGKPDQVVRTAHAFNTEITSLRVFKDETRVLSRAMDDTMKLWDLRHLKDPLYTWENLPNDCSGLDACISPDETMVVTGTSSDTPQASLEIFDVASFKHVQRVPIARLALTETSSQTASSHASTSFAIPCVAWPESLNQLVVGGSDGFVRMYYDATFSERGALLFVNRPAVSRQQALQGFQAPIFTPDNLPAGFKQTRTGEIRRVRLRNEDYRSEKVEKTKVPPLPSEARAATTGIVSTMLGQLHGKKNEDPVEALRAYASLTEKEPVFVSKAYEKTQPKPVLDYTMEDGDDEKLVGGVSKCPRCGLKLCQCGYMRVAQAVKGPDAFKLRKIG